MPRPRISPPAHPHRTVRVRALVSFASQDRTFGRRLEYDIPGDLAAIYIDGDLVERVHKPPKSR